ncbi:unnamed protein product [Parajaminaea phylloscopi]
MARESIAPDTSNLARRPWRSTPPGVRQLLKPSNQVHSLYCLEANGTCDCEDIDTAVKNAADAAVSRHCASQHWLRCSPARLADGGASNARKSMCR